MEGMRSGWGRVRDICEETTQAKTEQRKGSNRD